MRNIFQRIPVRGYTGAKQTPQKLIFSAALIFLLLLPVVSANAIDWGLQLNQTLFAAGSPGGSSDIQYSGTLIPWFSTPLGSPDKWTKGAIPGKLYLSAGMTILATSEYADKTLFFIPELLRTELTWRMKAGHELRFGRMIYTDPIGFIANGLFDGAGISFALKNNILRAGIWYTGLLYKRNAGITMKDDDLFSYSEELNYRNFSGTYFAPRRLIMAIDWENPYLVSWLRLKASFLCQFDFGGGDKYHSQYLAAKAVIPFKSFLFDFGGCFAMAQNSGVNKIMLAGELGAAWMLPTRLRDQLKLTGKFTSGNHSGALAAFVPITTEPQGDILQAKLSGLSVIRLEYTARPHDKISFNVASSYFILGDLNTYKGYPQNSSGQMDGRLLGNEFSGRLVWSPFSDLQINLGGGIFLPSMGNASGNKNPLLSVDLNVALAIF